MLRRTSGRSSMQKKYRVKLTEEERAECEAVLAKLSAKSQKARRAKMLLKADESDAGPGWTDERVAGACDARSQTVENLRKRLVTAGFAVALHGKPRKTPPTPPKLDGEQEARLLAMRTGEPPEGYGKWSLRLLADRMVELRVVDSISRETVRRCLKKTA